MSMFTAEETNHRSRKPARGPVACLWPDPSSCWVFLFILFFFFFNLFLNAFSPPVVSGLPGSRPAEAAVRGGGSKERLLPQQRPWSSSGQVLGHRGFQRQPRTGLRLQSPLGTGP